MISAQGGEMILNMFRRLIIGIDLSGQKCLIKCLPEKLWITAWSPEKNSCFQAADKLLLG